MAMDWIRGQKLGHGSFGTVNLAVPRCQDNQFPPLMAVKSCGALFSSQLTYEKVILDQLKDCPQVIRCVGDSFSLENGQKLYNVLLEYASGGDLADKIKNSEDRKLPEYQVRQYTKTLLKGLHYIHKFGYVHCDVKLQNILLGHNGQLKIADFGLAKRSGERTPFRGTPLYMSPETVTSGEQEAPADIWALGCMVAEMLSGTSVWKDSTLATLLVRIGLGEEVPAIAGDISEIGQDFLRKCFLRDPNHRWTAAMLLNHPFVEVDEFDNIKRSPMKQEIMSPSPRCPFDFPDWESPLRRSITSPRPTFLNGSPADRLRRLSVGKHTVDYSFAEDWMTVR